MPDGLSLVYQRNQQIWKIDSDRTDAERLSSTAGAEPAVSPDGRWIVFQYGCGAGGTFTPAVDDSWKV